MREIINKPYICFIYPLNHKIPKFQVIPTSKSIRKNQKLSILAIFCHGVRKPLLYGQKSPQMREIMRKPYICIIYPLNHKIPKFQVIPISKSIRKNQKMSILAIFWLLSHFVRKPKSEQTG